MEAEYLNYVFKDATIPELEAMYKTFSVAEENAGGLTTPEGKMFSGNVLAVCNELDARGEGQRTVFLLTQSALKETDTEELQDFYRLLVKLTKAEEGSVLGEHFTECGDPISNAASVFECFIWFMETELERRGANWRDVYNGK